MFRRKGLSPRFDAQEAGGTRDTTVPADEQRNGPTRTAAPLGAHLTG
ncbi:hypothetical protein N8I84_35455 [Streptomyces cynarae]|uniref:Uncharacterized protein n=1 Tax=Streptomyces cynarae TaxID=2981134 RepID=A0ABY6EB15_9ACTN|nr:hypothetical protein [Streptomyces cynarae]UXY23402.1 hypothetical protein N8I84_35455 [Streptomyces cynarae]